MNFKFWPRYEFPSVNEFTIIFPSRFQGTTPFTYVIFSPAWSSTEDSDEDSLFFHLTC